MKIALRMLLVLAIVATGFNAEAQRKQKQEKIATPEFPVSEKTNKVHYTKVVQTKGTQAELYKRAEAWFKSHYKNPGDVLKTRDAEGGLIIGKHRFTTKIKNPKTGVESKGDMFIYTIRIMVKDGRYKVVVTDVKLKGSTNFELTDVVRKHEGGYTDKMATQLVQADAFIQKLLADLEKGMAPPAKEKSEDW